MMALNEVQKAEDQEKENEDKLVIADSQDPALPRFIFRHDGKFRMRWDLLVIIFTLYNCVYLPFEVAFGDQLEENLI